MLLNLEGKCQFGCSFVRKKRTMRDLLESSDVECGPTTIIITQKRYVVRRNKYWGIPLNLVWVRRGRYIPTYEKNWWRKSNVRKAIIINKSSVVVGVAIAVHLMLLLAMFDRW